MKVYGLIGYPLTHSFSKKYFTEKFAREVIADSQYDLFELPDISALPALLKTPDLCGLNVTIPHKQAVLPYIDRLDRSAQKVGAVNVIKLEADGSRTGYNSDYYGFQQSLLDWLEQLGVSVDGLQALVLGTGGASKAVAAALADLSIPFKLVSRTVATDRATTDRVAADQAIADSPVVEQFTYEQLPDVIHTYQLVINTSPVGTYPHTDEAPAIPYQQLTYQHLLYDLVYNPAETQFMRRGRAQGAATHNGLRMLELQAEKAWQIWQS